MHRLAALTTVAFLASPTIAAARHESAWYPTCAQAHKAARVTMGSYASNLDGKLILGPCARRGDGTTVTRVRIAGGVRPERFRVLVTGMGIDVFVRARPITRG